MQTMDFSDKLHIEIFFVFIIWKQIWWIYWNPNMSVEVTWNVSNLTDQYNSLLKSKLLNVSWCHRRKISVKRPTFCLGTIYILTPILDHTLQFLMITDLVICQRKDIQSVFMIMTPNDKRPAKVLLCCKISGRYWLLSFLILKAL